MSIKVLCSQKIPEPSAKSRSLSRASEISSILHNRQDINKSQVNKETEVAITGTTEISPKDPILSHYNAVTQIP